MSSPFFVINKDIDTRYHFYVIFDIQDFTCKDEYYANFIIIWMLCADS